MAKIWKSSVARASALTIRDHVSNTNWRNDFPHRPTQNRHDGRPHCRYNFVPLYWSSERALIYTSTCNVCKARRLTLTYIFGCASNYIREYCICCAVRVQLAYFVHFAFLGLLHHYFMLFRIFFLYDLFLLFYWSGFGDSLMLYRLEWAID